ncbi:MAG: hypothetical protein QW815_07080 [Nitrososphaerota archaeon]
MDRILLLAVIVSVAYFLLLSLPAVIVFGTAPSPSFFWIIASTATYATASSLIVLPVSFILGFALAFRPTGSYITPLILFSTAIPHTAIGVLLAPTVFSLKITDTGAAIVLGMFVVSLPIGVGVMRASFAAQGVELEEFLRSMGVRGLRLQWFYLRASPASVLLAALLSWFRAFSELGVFLIVAQRPQTVGIYIFEEFLKSGPTSVVSASQVLLAVAIVLTLVMVVLERAGNP